MRWDALRRPVVLWVAAAVAVVAGLIVGLSWWARPQARPMATPLVLDFSNPTEIAILQVADARLTRVTGEEQVRTATRPLGRMDPVAAGAPGCPRNFVVTVQREGARPVVIMADPDCPRLEVAGHPGGWEAPAAFRTWLGEQTKPEEPPPATQRPPAQPSPPPEAPRSPEAAARAWIAALERDDASAAFTLLSAAGRRAAGGSPTAWAERGLRTLRANWTGWERADVVLERIFDDTAVVTVAGPRTAGGIRLARDAAALALVREGGGWRVALGGPAISPQEPDPGAAVPAGRLRLGAAVRAERAVRSPRLHLDATPLETAYSGQALSAVTAWAEVDVRPGPRVVTVYAEDGAGVPSALAWAFTAAGD